MVRGRMEKAPDGVSPGACSSVVGRNGKRPSLATRPLSRFDKFAARGRLVGFLCDALQCPPVFFADRIRGSRLGIADVGRKPRFRVAPHE